MLRHALLASAAILAAGVTVSGANAQSLFDRCNGPFASAAECGPAASRTDSVVQRDTFQQSRTVYRPATVEGTATVMQPETVRTRRTVNEQVQVPVARTEMQPVTVQQPHGQPVPVADVEAPTDE